MRPCANRRPEIFKRAINAGGGLNGLKLRRWEVPRRDSFPCSKSVGVRKQLE